jgi:glucose/mannose-6-phosphate isomerase
MRDDVLAQPAQLADALWRYEAAGVPSEPAPGGFVVCGMGGSAIGGDLAAAAIGERAQRPLRTVRGYAPDAWLGPDHLVLCASYSGMTEETLACFEAAGVAGARRVALTTGGELAERARAEGVPVIGVPGGMQPRAGVVYMTVAALQCAAACGAAPSLREEIEAAAPALTALGDDAAEAEAVAAAIGERIAVVHGTGPTAAVARRWKTQINENAKLPAFASELPEANHNEIEGWGWGAANAPLAAVFLTHPDHGERVARRLVVTAERLRELGVPVVEVGPRGDGAVARVLSQAMLGDLVSVALAEAIGVDATPVAAIEDFKQALRASN